VIRYELALKDAYLIGTGFSKPGLTDLPVQRDAEGNLFVGRRAIKGLVRDAAESLCDWHGSQDDAHRLWRCTGRHSPDTEQTLCRVTVRTEPGEGPCVICRLFGSAHSEGTLSFTDALLPEELRSLLRAESLAAACWNSEIEVRPHNAVDPALRRAQEDFFFRLEAAKPIGGKFCGTVEFRGNGPVAFATKGEDVALVWTAMRLVTEFGGKRRRGLGGCEFRVLEPNCAAWHDTYEPALRGLLADV
jgi:CRISPR/Cas system CSM-associated protein Csm3 (group 7 of RAMP superfamily)